MHDPTQPLYAWVRKGDAQQVHRADGWQAALASTLRPAAFARRSCTTLGNISIGINLTILLTNQEKNMPLPLIPLAVIGIKAIIAKAAVAKTVAVAAKGTAVLAKAAAGHGAVVAKTVTVATQTYGATAVISTAAALAISVGAAAIILEKGQKLKRALENGNITEALVAAPSLLSELDGLGGLDDVRSTLNSFIASGGNSHVQEVAERTGALLTAMETRVKTA